MLCCVSDLQAGGEATGTSAGEWRELLCRREAADVYGQSTTP